MLAVASSTSPLVGAGAEPLVDTVPERGRDDAQLWNFPNNVLRDGSWNATIPVGPCDLNPVFLVPDPLPDVLLVPQHREDRGVTPAAAFLVAATIVVRGGNPVLVELRSDLLHRHSASVKLEDSDDHRSLGRDNDPHLPRVIWLRWIGLDLGPKSVSLSPRGKASKRATFEAAVRLRANHLDEAVADECHRAEGHPRPLIVRRHSGRDVDDPDPH